MVPSHRCCTADTAEDAACLATDAAMDAADAADDATDDAKDDAKDDAEVHKDDDAMVRTAGLDMCKQGKKVAVHRPGADRRASAWRSWAHALNFVQECVVKSGRTHGGARWSL